MHNVRDVDGAGFRDRNRKLYSQNSVWKTNERPVDEDGVARGECRKTGDKAELCACEETRTVVGTKPGKPSRESLSLLLLSLFTPPSGESTVAHIRLSSYCSIEIRRIRVIRYILYKGVLRTRRDECVEYYYYYVY